MWLKIKTQYINMDMILCVNVIKDEKERDMYCFYNYAMQPVIKVPLGYMSQYEFEEYLGINKDLACNWPVEEN